MAVLPASEFDKLQRIKAMSDNNMQDKLDIMRADEIMHRVRQHNEELIPDEVMRKIYQQRQNRIRVYRQWRGYQINELANVIDITPGYLSNIERGVREGTITVYQKLAKALQTDIESLLPRTEML